MSYIEPVEIIVTSKWASASLSASHHVFLQEGELDIDGVRVVATLSHPAISGELRVDVVTCEDEVHHWVSYLAHVLDRVVKTPIFGKFGFELWSVFKEFGDGYKLAEPAFGASYFLTHTADNSGRVTNLSHVTLPAKTAYWTTELDKHNNTKADRAYCLAQIENVLRTPHRSSTGAKIMKGIADRLNFFNK